MIRQAWISSSGKRKENVNRWKSYFLQEKQPVCEVFAWLFFSVFVLCPLLSVWLLEFSKSVNTLFERNGGQSLFEVKHNCNKASNYTASSKTGLALADTYFLIGSATIWDTRIYLVKTLHCTFFWWFCPHPITVFLSYTDFSKTCISRSNVLQI